MDDSDTFTLTDAPEFTGMKLLLVEDNPVNMEIATLLLTDRGFTLDKAVNGREAVEKVEASAPGEYAAVLMDIQMPVMSGYEATRAIRALPDEQLAKIPVIAMTANAFAEDIRIEQESGMDGHVTKPVDVQDLIRTLSRLL